MSDTPGFCVHDLADRRLRAAVNLAGSKPIGVKYATPAEFDALQGALSKLSVAERAKVFLVDWTQMDKRHRRETGARRG